MTDDAPDKIWLQPECCAKHSEFGRLWCENDDFDCEDNAPGTAYTRTDLADATITAQAAEIARLRELVGYIAGTNTDHVRVVLAGNPNVCQRVVAAARAELEVGK